MYLKGLIILFLSLFALNALAETFKGNLEIKVSDDFQHNQSRTTYVLKTNDNNYDLNLPKSLKTGLSSGPIVIEGELNFDNSIQVKTAQVEKNLPSTTLLSDQRTLLVLAVNFLDKKATDIISLTQLDNQIFKSSVSVKKNYLVSSSNQLKWISDANSDGLSDIYAINLNYNMGGICNADSWAADAKDQATAMGIDLSKYTNFLFVLPQKTPCPWGGQGWLNCRSACHAWAVGWSELKGVIAHELGHNVGFHHAATDLNNDGVTDDEYGDGSCVMGAWYRQINAPHRDQIGWYAAFPEKIKVVTQTGDFILGSLDNSYTQLQVLKVNKKDMSGAYYISYRTNIAPFGMNSPYKNAVNIHRTVNGNAHSWWIKGLAVGDTFVDPVNKLTVSVLAMGGNQVTVHLKIG